VDFSFDSSQTKTYANFSSLLKKDLIFGQRRKSQIEHKLNKKQILLPKRDMLLKIADESVTHIDYNKRLRRMIEDKSK